MVVGVAAMDVLQGISLVLGITATMGSLIFVLVRYMLLPYLHEQLVTPLAEAKVLAEETNRQVSINGNRTPESPTLKDEMSNLRQAVLSVDERLEKYLAWASIEHHRIWDAIRFPNLPPRAELDQPPTIDGDGDDDGL